MKVRSTKQINQNNIAKDLYRRRAVQNYNRAVSYRNQQDYEYVVASNLWQCMEFALMAVEQASNLVSRTVHNLEFHLQQLYENGIDVDVQDVAQYDSWRSAHKGMKYEQKDLDNAFLICLQLIDFVDNL